MIYCLVVIDDFYIARPRFTPFKANPVLLVDTDTVLTLAIANKLLQSIARRRLEVLELLCRIQSIELTRSDRPKTAGTEFTSSSARDSVEDILSTLVSE